MSAISIFCSFGICCAALVFEQNWVLIQHIWPNNDFIHDGQYSMAGSLLHVDCKSSRISGVYCCQAGEEVYCLGRSQKRGYLVVEHGGGTIHIPHHYTELRVWNGAMAPPVLLTTPSISLQLTPPNSPPPTGRPQPHTSDL